MQSCSASLSGVVVPVVSLCVVSCALYLVSRALCLVSCVPRPSFYTVIPFATSSSPFGTWGLGGSLCLFCCCFFVVVLFWLFFFFFYFYRPLPPTRRTDPRPDGQNLFVRGSIRTEPQKNNHRSTLKKKRGPALVRGGTEFSFVRGSINRT